VSDASTPPAPPSGTSIGDLLLRVVAFAALVVGGVVAAAEANAWWTIGLAIAGLGVTAAAVALTVQHMLGDGEDAGVALPSRLATAVPVGVAAVALVLAVALPDGESSAAGDTAATPAAAMRTVRLFLAQAVLDDNAYAACQYLTPGAATHLAETAGPDETCRDALMRDEPTFAGIQSSGQLRGVDLHAVVHRGTADVTTVASGRPRVTFVLQPATAAEHQAFEAPPAGWRIASGEDAVLGLRPGSPASGRGV
jgi:hypothetical protein